MRKAAIGVIGVGMMGAGMARCLLAAGHPVTLRAHRNRSRIEPLLDRGAREVDETAALVDACDVLLTCLPNAEVVETLADEIAPLMRAGQVWIDTTSSRPRTSESIAARLAERGAIFADAPVTGGPPQAETGELISLVGCEEEHLATVEAVVGTYSKSVRRFGEAGRGHAAKLLNNLVSQGTMILLADAFRTAEATGVDRRALFDVMMGGAARSGTLEKAVAPALEGDLSGAQFTVANAEKDLRYARDLIAEIEVSRAEVAAVLASRLGALVSNGRGGDFVSTMLGPELRSRAG
ncbi:MAG: NAD(P)-dependent oxidoreductase [Pseudomonadota bacterium]